MRPIYNVITKQHATMPCNIWGNRGLDEDLDAQAFADGWRYVASVPHGERYRLSFWADDGAYWREGIVDYTDAEWDAILAAEKAARQAAEAVARAVEQNLDEYERRMKAVVLVLVDEINLLRGWITGFKAAVAASTSLADLKTRVAATAAMPDRTREQAKTAIANKVAALHG